MALGNSSRILIRGVNWIGDAVMTMPSLRALRKADRDSAVSLLVRPSVAPLFAREPNVDEILLYENEYRGVMGKLRLAQLLRMRNFSTAILLQNAFDAALIASLAGIRKRIGYNRDGRGFLLTNPVPFNRNDRKVHHIQYYLDILSAAGIRTEYSPPWVFLTLEERLRGRETLSSMKRPVLGINPGATYGSAKRWFPDRFAEVARRFTAHTGGSVVILGSKHEAAVAQEIAGLISGEDTKLPPPGKRPKGISGSSFTPGRSLMNLAGKTHLRELVSIISECDLFLSNDSGPMHIAYAVGTPLVALFGSTDPTLTGPVGDGSIVINATPPCSPCFERTCRSNTMRCMNDITTDEVYAAIKQLTPGKAAVFFDRDGTLCRDAHYLNSWQDFEVFPAIESLRLLKEKGFILIGVTNQSGVARGLIEESFVREVNKVFIEHHGFDDFYYCPHNPDDHCSCRKPETGMIAKARAEHAINLTQSYVVGDKDADMLLAKAIGAKGILVTTGQEKDSSHADFRERDLETAVNLIIGKTTRQ